MIALEPAAHKGATCRCCGEDSEVLALAFGASLGRHTETVHLCATCRLALLEVVSGDPGARRAQLGRVLSMRGVEDPCPECQGMGVRSYGSTATWRGGMGGQMITNDVCDRCWGSGDRYRSGCDLRKLRDEESARVAARAVDALASAAGAKFTSARRQVAEIATVLRDAAAAADKKRNGNPARDSIVFAPLARSLASMLDLAARSPAPPAPKE